MPFSNIRVTSPLGVVRYFQPDQLSGVCLQLCGGGWTERQTLNALLLQAELRDKRVAKHKVKGVWLIELLE